MSDWPQVRRSTRAEPLAERMRLRRVETGGRWASMARAARSAPMRTAEVKFSARPVV